MFLPWGYHGNIQFRFPLECSLHLSLQTVWSWAAYHRETRTVARAFIDLGLEKYGSVCILGFNSPEWILSDIAAIFAGGFATGIYPTNGPEAVRYILEHSKCNILVVEDQRQLDKIWSYRGDLPNLRKIVQYTGVPNNPGVLSWKVRLQVNVPPGWK